MNKISFELTEEKKEIDSVTLYRIRATKDNAHVKKGTLGGWVEDIWVKGSNNTIPVIAENAWLGGEAVLTSGSKIADEALVDGNAIVSNNSTIAKNAKVGDNVWVLNSSIRDNAIVKENASIVGSVISDNAIIKDSANITNGSIISGNVVIGKNADINNSKISENVILSSSCSIPFGCSLTGDIEFKNCISSFPGIHLSQEVEINGEKWAIGVVKDNLEEKTRWEYPTQRKNVDSLFFGVKGIDKTLEGIDKTYTDVLEFVNPKGAEGYFLARTVDTPDREISVNILMDLASREDKYKDALALHLFMEEYIPLTKKFNPKEAARIIQESTPIVRLEKTDAARSGDIINTECLYDIRESFVSEKKMKECAKKHNLPYALLSDLRKDPIFSPNQRSEDIKSTLENGNTPVEHPNRPISR